MAQIRFGTFLAKVTAAYEARGAREHLFKQLQRVGLTTDSARHDFLDLVDDVRSVALKSAAGENMIVKFDHRNAYLLDSFRDDQGSVVKAAAFHFYFLSSGDRYKEQADALGEAIDLNSLLGPAEFALEAIDPANNVMSQGNPVPPVAPVEVEPEPPLPPDRAYAERYVSFDKWLAARQQSRDRTHPLGSDRRAAPLLPNETSADLLASLEQRVPKQVFLEGEIASGKSSCIEIAAAAWRDAKPGRTITILPLTSQFSAGRNWSATDAAASFIDVMAELKPEEADKHLFIVEDAHEGVIDKNVEWAGEKVRDLSHLRMILTSRPEAATSIREALLEKWSVKPVRATTALLETADALAEAALPSNSAAQNAILGLVPELGNSLIALAAALRILQRDLSQEVTIELAFRAIDSELTRLFDLKTVQRFGLTGDDVIELKLATLTAWMLGGIEAPFSPAQLAKLLDKTDLSRSIQLLELMEEVFLSEDGRYHVKRHPGWGLLVMKAMDEYAEFDPFRDALRRRVASRLLEGTHYTTFDTGLAAFLFGVLALDIRSVRDVGFFCVGRHMHDEFLQAASVLQHHANFRKRAALERSELLLYIANSGRRCRPGDIAQRQQLLRYGVGLIDTAIQDIEQIGDRAARDRLLGYALYERGYAQLHRGNFDASANDFGLSAEHEARVPNREIFGIASAAMQAIALSHFGKPNEARVILDRQEARLEELGAPPADRIIYRFGANHWYAAFELALAARDFDSAAKSMKKNMSWQTASGMSISPAVHQARLELLKGDFEAALSLAKIAVDSREASVSAEDFTVANRVMADALLATGNPDAAADMYKSLLPPPGSEFFDAEVQLIRDKRLALLERGVEPREILAQTRV